MILSDKTIKRMIRENELVIDPLTLDQIQPASVDLRLGTNFLKMKEHQVGFVSLDQEIQYESFDSEEIIIPPQFLFTCNYY